MIEIAAISLVYVAYLAFATKRMMTYMHVLQQEEYENGRLFKWMTKNKVFDKRLTFALLVLGGGWFFLPEFMMNFTVFICFVFTAYMELDPRKNSKKKLVATARAKRTFFPALLLMALLGVPCFFFAQPWLWIFNVQILPFALLFTNMYLKPVEDMIQLKYWNEANKKLLDLKPTVIGITGSFGKTSVKHMLGHILKTQAPTLITPGSVNTPMGIARIIREELDESHKYFIVEMGAYGPGSIKRLCRLTPPDMGIITSIGHAHYERFRSLETVSKAKFELAESVVSRGGTVVIHERTLRFPHPRTIKSQSKENYVVCGEPPETDPNKRRDVSYLEPNDLHIQKVDQLYKGLLVTVTWKNVTYTLELPLYGLHHGHNAALAFVAALELGIDSGDIQTALMSMPQIEHRLEVKRQADGSTLIDDAYNSNPVGFRSALDLMSLLKEKGRKILVTPGMVELGVAHEEAHDNVGKYAGQICDIAVVVNSDRIPSFVSGFKSTGSGKQVIEVKSFADASEWIEKNRQEGDVILIENDLPDMYERIPKI